jgi:hypothetical protein
MKIQPPDLQELVAAGGGYDRITPEMWAAFDHAMEVYEQTRRAALADDHDNFDIGGVPEQAWPYARCVVCGEEAQFGYRRNEVLHWFCALCRPAKYWADARRGRRS